LRVKVKRYFSAALFVALCCAAASAQTLTNKSDLEEVKASAEESGRAFMSGDFAKLADLTYPKIVRKAGGRAKMIAFLKAGKKQMESEGFEPISYTVGEPKEIVRVGVKLFVIVPTTLKAKYRGDVLTQRAYMIGVSAGRVRGWTFIDGSSLDESKLRAIAPEAVGRIKLPNQEAPTSEEQAP
jgi:hypothetical protein